MAALSKTHKKIDNNICRALTAACQQSLECVPGFIWLTHQANYSHFPGSLLITVVFDSAESLQQAFDDGDCEKMQQLIQVKLLGIGVRLKSLERQIIFDNEQACQQQHNGDWDARLAKNARLVVTDGRKH